MFKELNNKINKTILFLSTFFIIIVSLISVSSVSNYMFDEFYQSSKDMINLAITNFNFDLEIIKSSAEMLGDDADIKKYITNTNNPLIVVNKVSSLSNYFDSVLGATLYSIDGKKSISATTISDYPTLDELKEVSDISNFIISANDTLLNIRTLNIAGFYNSTHYNENYGIISYIIKIYNSQLEVIGLLVVDLDPEYIYNNYFNYSNYPNFNNIVALIQTNNNDYLKYEKNLNMNTYLNQSINDQVVNFNYYNFYYKTQLVEDYYITSIIPSANLYNQIYTIIGLFLLIDTILILLAKYTAQKMAQYVTVPLNKLLNRMKNDEITRR